MLTKTKEKTMKQYQADFPRKKIKELKLTYDYWIWRPSLALNPSKKYQIVYKNVHIYLCRCMRNKYPCKSEIV